MVARRFRGPSTLTLTKDALLTRLVSAGAFTAKEVAEPSLQLKTCQAATVIDVKDNELFN